MQTAHAATTFDPNDYSTYCRAQNSETDCTQLIYCKWDESRAVSCIEKTCDNDNYDDRESVFCQPGTYYDRGSHECEYCPAGYANSSHPIYIYPNTDTNTKCYPHDECIKCTGNTIADYNQSVCSSCRPGYVANDTHTECTECPTGKVPTPPPSGEDGDYTCEKCPPGQIAHEGECKSCGAFGTPNEDQTKCVCWVNMVDASSDYYKLCNPDSGYIEYAILFNNIPAISSDKTDVVEVKYQRTGSNTDISVRNYPDHAEIDYNDEVQIYTDKTAGQKPTADNNDYLFKGWRDENNPNINIIIEDTLTATDAHKILNPSEMTEDDKVQYFITELGEDWPTYGKELTAIWEKCEIKYKYDGSYSPAPTACKCNETCDNITTELPKNAPGGRKFLGWFCKDDANCIDSCTGINGGDSQVSAIESCTITDGAPILTAVFEDCPAGSYCPQGEKEPTPCPAGTTSERNSETKNDCYIKGGESRICNRDGSKCFEIPAGKNYNIKKQ